MEYRKNMLTVARENHFAMPAFNVESFDVLKGIFMGSCKCNAPIILQTTEPAVKVLNPYDIVYFVNSLSEQYKVPVLLNLDHASDMELIKECVQAGYHSVMIDASEKSMADNISLTNQVIDIAQKKNVLVEAEVGVVGVHGTGDKKTAVNDVIEFCKNAKVSSLAVSVGSSHGGNGKKARIDFLLLKEIYYCTETPLVLHGSSGVVDEDLNEVMNYGIVKVNIETELRMLVKNALLEYHKSNPENIKIRSTNAYMQNEIADYVMKKCELLKCKDKAHFFKN